MKIAFIGLPSAGKSSIINSLIGKRLAKTGIAKTTEEPTLYNDNIFSDDGISLELLDLPGVADIEDVDEDFGGADYNNIIGDQNIDLVIWTTDITRGFLTNHELTEYNSLKGTINNIKNNKGNGIQLIVLVSKMEFDVTKSSERFKYDTMGTTEINGPELTDEIYGPEITTHNDMYTKIKSVVKEDVICYNAHGRSYHHKNSTSNLKTFVAKYCPNNINIEFNMKKYYDNINKTNDESIILYIKNILLGMYNCYTQEYTSCDSNYAGTDIPHYDSNYILNEKKITDDGKQMICRVCFYKNHTTKCRTSFEDGTENPYIFIDDKIKKESITTYSQLVQPVVRAPRYCRHGYTRHRCLVTMKFFESCKLITDIYNKVIYDEYKNEIIDILINSFNAIVCYNIRLSSKPKQNIDIQKMNDTQIFNYLMLTNDILNVHEKLYLYTMLKDSIFNKEFNIGIDKHNIYSIEELYSGNFYNFVKPTSENNFKKYTKEIYTNNIIDKVKEIRLKAYGEQETNIDRTMIPLAYNTYGLFWL